MSAFLPRPTPAFVAWDAHDLYAVGMAGLLHDYGKALVPAAILNAPRALKPWEMEIMHSHVLRGYERLKADKAIAPEVLLGVLQHHEKFNGTGYPYGLAGNDISLYGRVLSLSDVYDALTSWRVYKRPLSPHQVLAIMYQMRGQAWTPQDVDLFVKFMGIYPVGSRWSFPTASAAWSALPISSRRPNHRLNWPWTPQAAPCSPPA